MQYNKIVLAGGNGYIGQVLARHFAGISNQVIILSRKAVSLKGNVRTVTWNGVKEGNWVKELEGADLLVNLCGKNVNCRYTEKNKAEIIRSRVVPTVLLGSVVAKLQQPPALWINVTSATIYRHAEDRPQDEAHGEIGAGFSVDVCRRWEDAFFATDTPATRKVALRMGIVLGRSDGVFPRLHNLVKLGMGGKQGNGRQYVSWIHEQDVAQSIEWLLRHPEMDGVVNCTAPVPVANQYLMNCIRKTCQVPFALPAPAWLLGVGAIVIGTETELILKSRWVLPNRLTEAGYQFRFPEIEAAVEDILA